MPEPRPQPDAEMLANMWAWKVCYPSAIRLSPSPGRVIGHADGKNLDELIAPIVFLQLRGSAAAVKARWESLRDALLSNREGAAGQAEYDAVEAALGPAMTSLRQVIYPAALAAEQELERLGCRFNASANRIEFVTGGRPRNALRVFAAATLKPYRVAFRARRGHWPDNRRRMARYVRRRLQSFLQPAMLDERQLLAAVNNVVDIDVRRHTS